MIPIQVKLEGFMSYRDEATLAFDGAALWMLCGRNGAGKSTVFDAMKFALFGTHRDGTQGAEALIHHDKNSLRVEFDFALGDDVYRVQRTLARNGRPSFQALHIAGPNPPRPGAASPQAVPETISKPGLKRWVDEHIGLNEETFSAAVLLQQGKSDALLSADNETKHTMLTQIVDLSAYERLHTLADERRKKLTGEADALQRKLDATPAVDEAAIAELATQVEELKQTLDAARQTLDDNLRLQPRAERWQGLLRTQAEVAGKLEQARLLAAQADAIRRDAARLDELSRVVPILQKAQQERALLAQSQARATTLREAVVAARDRAAQAQEQQTTLGHEMGQAQEAQSHHEQARNEANATLLRLGPIIHELRELARLRNELELLDQDLQTYAATLDAELAEAEAQAARLRETQAALPALSRLSAARTAWRKACASLEKTRAALAALAPALERAHHEQRDALQQQEQAATALQAAQRAETQAGTLLEQVQAQRARFEEVESAPTCNYCGQPLTPEDRERERARLNAELERAQHAALQAGERRLAAAAAHQAMLQQVRLKGEAIEALRDQERTAQEQERHATRERQTASDQAQTARGELSPAYAERVVAGVAVDEAIPAELRSDYPSPEVLATLRLDVKGLAAHAAHLEALRAQVRQRDARRMEREPVARRCAGLQERYPAAQAAARRLEWDAAHAHKENAEREFQKLTPTIAALQRTLHEAQTTLAQATRAENEAAVSVAAEAATQEQLQRVWEQLRTELPPAWHDDFDHLTSQILAGWQQERQLLESGNACGKLEALEDADRQVTALEEQQAQIAGEMSEVPEPARCPVAELKATETALRRSIETQSATHEAAKGKQSQLEHRRAARQTLEAETAQAARGARLHRLLADALGRDALQRHLLQEAEASIVEAANDVLDRISSGTLRLEMRRGEDGEVPVAGGRRGAPKALDLVAYNNQSGVLPLPLPLAFLSGSQRFRVAVSLALGIGHYATQGARRVEAVIIDEGFGSLDKQGRHEIIDELHALQSVLKRIILVSHQEEFSDAFSNRYLVELQDGTSRASLQD